MRQGPAWTTVTGITREASSKIWVIPTLVPRIPLVTSAIAFPSFPAVLQVELDLDVDACGQVQPLERVHGLRRRIEDVDHPLVGPHLEVLPRVLVLVRG